MTIKLVNDRGESSLFPADLQAGLRAALEIALKAAKADEKAALDALEYHHTEARFQEWEIASKVTDQIRDTKRSFDARTEYLGQEKWT